MAAVSHREAFRARLARYQERQRRGPGPSRRDGRLVRVMVSGDVDLLECGHEVARTIVTPRARCPVCPRPTTSSVQPARNTEEQS